MPAPLDSRTRPPVLSWVIITLLLGVLFAVYYPALHGGFVWDDDSWTADIAHLTKDWSGLWRIWTEFKALQQYFPMTGTSFWVDARLWGSWTLPYHVENVLLHAACAILLWRLLTRLQVPGAALAAAVFALHPVMVESVAWITERKNVLSLAFMLGGLLAYGRYEAASGDSEPGKTKGSPGRWYLLSWLLLLLALTSKITAFVFAPTVLLLAWRRRGRIRWGQDLVPMLPFFALTLALGGLVWWLETYNVGAEGKDFSAPLAQRAVDAGHAFWFYIGKLLWPLDLCFLYPDWRTADPAWWQWGWLGGAFLLVVTLWLLRNKIGRGPLVAVLFYTGGLLPVSGLLNVYGGLFAPVWDHWIYVPSLGILVPVCALIARLAERTRQAWVQPALAGLLLPLLAFQSWRQTGQYADKETLWVETIRRNPAAWLAHNNHGSALVLQGKLEEAVVCFRKCLETRPSYADAWNNLGGALVQQGKHEESLLAYQKAVPLAADLAPYIRHNMGNALFSLGRMEEAMEQFRASLALKPDYDEALNSLGAALTQKGLVDEGIEHLRHALRLTPNYHQAHNNLGSALQKKGDLEGAQAAYEKAVQIEPKFVEALFNLGELMFKKQDLAAAISRYQEVLAIKPDHAKAHYNLGLCHTEQGDLDKAQADYERAISINPAYASAHNNLANNLLKTGRIREAVEHFQKAVETDAGQLAALNNLAWVLATDTDATLRDGARALEYATRAAAASPQPHPVVLSTLAAAYAENGRFDEAAAQASRALELAAAAGDQSLVTSLENYLKGFQSRQPVRIRRGNNP